MTRLRLLNSRNTEDLKVGPTLCPWIGVLAASTHTSGRMWHGMERTALMHAKGIGAVVLNANAMTDAKVLRQKKTLAHQHREILQGMHGAACPWA